MPCQHSFIELPCSFAQSEKRSSRLYLNHPRIDTARLLVYAFIAKPDAASFTTPDCETTCVLDRPVTAHCGCPDVARVRDRPVWLQALLPNHFQRHDQITQRTEEPTWARVGTELHLSQERRIILMQMNFTHLLFTIELLQCE